MRKTGPRWTGRSLSGYQQKHVWLNDGAGKFVDVAQAVGVTDTYDGRAVAFADLWNRGVLDVVVANQRGPLLLYKNTVAPDNKWIEFELEGTKSNRSAIGARGHALLERPAADAGSFRRQRLFGAKRSAAALRTRQESTDREGRDSLALGQRSDARQACAEQIHEVKEPQ